MVQGQAATRPSAWFRVIGGVSLVWNGFGGFDYAATQLRAPWYLAQFPAGMMDAIDAMPAWAVACWAIGVWASVAGSVLLLARRRLARGAFALSFVAAVVSMGWQELYGMSAGPLMTALLLAVIAALWWYSGRAAARGWLS